jgi:SAM-dependent methyltransferase
MLRQWLAEPETAGLPLDDPRTTRRHREIIVKKEFLRRIYDEWYRALVEPLPQLHGPILELGSGGGFFASVCPGVLRSDVQLISGVDVILDAVRLPVASQAVRAIVMTNVFHHISNVELFLAEVQRCLVPGGVLVMIEPWVTRWSRWVYTRLHHEPFDPDSLHWRVDRGGPLSGANSALPWIVFERDRVLFQARFPGLQILHIDALMSFCYLLSGGVSMRAIVPSRTFPIWRTLDRHLVRLAPGSAMFARIVVRRLADAA